MSRRPPVILYDHRGRKLAARSYFDNGYVGARHSTARSAINYFVGDAPGELCSFTRQELITPSPRPLCCNPPFGKTPTASEASHA